MRAGHPHPITMGKGEALPIIPNSELRIPHYQDIMYLHLGEDTVITTEGIIGIFDMDTSTVNKATRDYLAKAEKEKRIQYVNYDLPKSFIVTADKIFVSPINTNTLLKRIRN